MNQSHRLSRVSSDFSIERILAEDSDKKSSRNSKEFLSLDRSPYNRYEDSSMFPPVASTLDVASSASRVCFSNEEQANLYDSPRSEKNELSWLRCTRYRPPKLPRKSSNGKTCKRRPGAHPRIPFTTIQLQILEDKYRSTAYLSRRDVLQLSTTLRLPQSRVKIWFQNRRARDRRETGISGGNVTIISDDASPTEKLTNSAIAQSPPPTNPS